MEVCAQAQRMFVPQAGYDLCIAATADSRSSSGTLNGAETGSQYCACLVRPHGARRGECFRGHRAPWLPSRVLERPGAHARAPGASRTARPTPSSTSRRWARGAQLARLAPGDALGVYDALGEASEQERCRGFVSGFGATCPAAGCAASTLASAAPGCRAPRPESLLAPRWPQYFMAASAPTRSPRALREPRTPEPPAGARQAPPTVRNVVRTAAISTVKRTREKHFKGAK